MTGTNVDVNITLLKDFVKNKSQLDTLPDAIKTSLVVLFEELDSEFDIPN